MNLIKVKDIVIDLEKVYCIESSITDKGIIFVYFSDIRQVSVLDISLSDFCDLLKFYNIDIKELK